VADMGKDKILIIEDDHDIVEMLKYNLKGWTIPNSCSEQFAAAFWIIKKNQI
jgi:DNA-binding response OmpR family regulator